MATAGSPAVAAALRSMQLSALLPGLVPSFPGTWPARAAHSTANRQLRADRLPSRMHPEDSSYFSCGKRPPQAGPRRHDTGSSSSRGSPKAAPCFQQAATARSAGRTQQVPHQQGSGSSQHRQPEGASKQDLDNLVFQRLHHRSRTSANGSGTGSSSSNGSSGTPRKHSRKGSSGGWVHEQQHKRSSSKQDGHSSAGGGGGGGGYADGGSGGGSAWKAGTGRRGTEWFRKRWPGAFVHYSEYEEVLGSAAGARSGSGSGSGSAHSKHYRRMQYEGDDAYGGEGSRSWHEQFWRHEHGSSHGSSGGGSSHSGSDGSSSSSRFYDHEQYARAASWWQRFYQQHGAGTGSSSSTSSSSSASSGTGSRSTRSSSDAHHHSHHNRNHLSALGLAADARLDSGALKAAFRRAALRWHPDRHVAAADKAAAEERFKQAQQAYQALQGLV